MLEFIIIAIGAALGANLRFFLTNWFVRRYGGEFPWGTLFINVSGSLVIGAVLTLLTRRLVADPTYKLLLVTGFLGAYTTFSTFTYESISLIRQGEYWRALFNVAGSVLAGLGAVLIGITAGTWLA